jgi:two-component system NtrC family sensor kinase
MLTILSFPPLAFWALFGGNAPHQVRIFRLIATFAAMFVCSGLAFYRQHLAHTERARLIQKLSTSLDNVKRLQTQFVQSEKLAALGQLAAGAAHEINNPLSAIVGYADLLLTENAPTTRAYTLGQKIHDQARRTTALVTNLLSFARQLPAEKQLLDLHTILESAVRLRKIDAHNHNIRIELEGRNSVLPAVRGDPNQLLQVFHHLLGNAVDAMQETGGVLLIRALAEKGAVVIEFSDTGPGMKEPERVFDPFYTTKPIGKATGLGLSISYGIIQEHGGIITGFNRPEGGSTFRIELPAALASLPRVALAPASHRNS